MYPLTAWMYQVYWLVHKMHLECVITAGLDDIRVQSCIQTAGYIHRSGYVAHVHPCNQHSECSVCFMQACVLHCHVSGPNTESYISRDQTSQVQTKQHAILFVRLLFALAGIETHSTTPFVLESLPYATTVTNRMVTTS